jgi:WD40 repeat protein
MKFKLILLIFIAVSIWQPTLAQNPNQPVWKIGTIDDIKHVVFHPNSQVIATGGNNGMVIIYSAKDGSEIKRFDDGFNSDQATIFSPTGKYLAYGGSWGFRIIDFANYEIKQTINHPAYCIDINTQEKIAATGSNDEISFWNIETGELIKRLDKIVEPDIKGNTPSIYSIQFSPDGSHLALIMTNNELRFINLVDFTFDYIYKVGNDLMTFSSIIKYSIDGSMIAFATGLSNIAIQIMNVSTKEIINSIPGYHQGIGDIAFSVDDKYILFSNPDLAKMQIYSLNPFKLAYQYTGSFQTLSLSRDGKYFTAQIGQYLYLYLVPWNITGVGIIEKNQTRIYPIPSEEIIEFDYANNQSSTTKISINNLEGEFIKDIFNGYLEEGFKKFQINTDDLSNGIYFINVEQAGSMESFKFIIENRR